jgi:uncharacterized protein (DUF1697 family)
MTRFIAFLRAINVGGRTVKMDRLRGLFESLGFQNVETFIASGNVVFESSARNARNLETRIQDQLRRSLGYEVATFVRSVAELREIADHHAFKASERAKGDSLYVAFLPSAPGEESQEKLMSYQSRIDDFRVHGREVYWLCRKKFSESEFSGALLEKTLQMPATIRNVTTVTRLAEKCQSGVKSPVT